MPIKQKSVLVVDDDEDILKLLSKILQAAGYAVTTALSPAEGRKVLDQGLPHLIISDLNMEPENGFQFIQWLREQKKFQPVPIIVLSAVNEFNSVKRAISLGITDYVIKPIQPSMLLRKLRKAMLNKEFSVWNVEGGKDLQMLVKVDAEIFELGETGYGLSGPFKLTAGLEVLLNSPEFKTLGLDKCIHQASAQDKRYLQGGYFGNDVTFVSIKEEESSQIRKFLKELKK